MSNRPQATTYSHTWRAVYYGDEVFLGFVVTYAFNLKEFINQLQYAKLSGVTPLSELH